MARPRSEQAHNAALEATLELLLREGVEGVTFEEVASRSGVAKSTLYRHFGNRAGLISKAAGQCLVEHPTPDTGTLAGDLKFLFERFSQAEDERQVNDILPLLMDEAKRDPEIDELLASMLAERRRPIRTVLQLAQLRGEIGADVDLDTAMSILIGPFTYRKMVERKEVTPEFTDAVMAAAIAGLRATAGAPMA
ncbi:MAG: TetR/AcrR family transcriptional regulator [Acidimicrobiales bacterium]|nr:TetR/AcrR family transcriptional regulator [Actinomycetota bacterium]